MDKNINWYKIPNNMSSQSPDYSDRMLHFERRCREQGLSLTVQRRAILEVVLARQDHPTADQIFEDVKAKFPDISRTTVYRVLDTLVDIGVIGKPSHFGSATRYEPKIHRHHHLVCMECGHVIDIDDDGAAIDTAPILAKHPVDFEIADYSIHFHGICCICRDGRRSADEISP